VDLGGGAPGKWRGRGLGKGKEKQERSGREGWDPPTSACLHLCIYASIVQHCAVTVTTASVQLL